MILQGAFTCFYLAAVLGSDTLTVEEVAAAAAHLTDEEKLRLTRLLLFDNSRV